MVMILLSLYGLFLILRKRLEYTRHFLWLLPVAIALPYLANGAGWIMTEIGRQPWIVFGLLKTAQAVSPTVDVSSVLISLLVFTFLYAVLAIVDIYLLARYAREDGTLPFEEEHEDAALLTEAY